MARYFKEHEIEEFRECFEFHARNGQVTRVDELKLIMRSLGMSPTLDELKDYMRQKGGKMNRADFLDIVRIHRDKENVTNDLLNAFRQMDPQRKGTVAANELRRILTNWGEKITSREVDQLFRETNVNANGPIKYEQFVRVLSAPAPDYF